MADIQDTLCQLFRSAISEALGENYAHTDPALHPSGNPRFGDYQANLAMALAKQLGQKPRDLAQKIAEAVRHDGIIDKLEVAGPGFINITLTADALREHLAAMADSATLGLPAAEQPRTVVVDYSSPNVAKEMHVGHLRSTVIGDAIARVLSFQGHHVIRQNHLGDWGTQFGMLIEHLSETNWHLDDRNEHGREQIGDLNRLYQQAKQKFDADPDFADRARARVVALQSGDEDTLALWRALVAESKRHFNQIYDRLDVLLTDDDVRGESFYNDRLPGVVDALQQQGLLQQSQGAAVVFAEGFTDREGKSLPLIVRKSDGGYLYATTDLAAARFRLHELGATRMIYVTDARQSQHFAMVFAVLRQADWAGPDHRLDHVAFGNMLGADRKPFKTREGKTIRLSELLDQAELRARKVIDEKNPQLPENQRKEIAHVVGIGALKYADLASDRMKDYVFDFDRMLALDGNTAPYLQNAYVRIRSIFRKGNLDADHIQPEAMRIAEPAERALALKLMQWPNVIAAVADSLEPHRLCTYLYELAAAYHQFYEQCPVLTAADAITRDSRLAQSALTARTLARGLELLGIDVVEQM